MENERLQEVQGLTVSYKVFGEISAPTTVLLLHGWGARKELFDRAAREIRGKTGACVITLDLPGFGASSTPKSAWFTKDFSDSLSNFLDAVGIQHLSVLGGHSHGGRVAVRYAYDHPEKVDKLLLIDSAGLPAKHSLRMKMRVKLFKALKSLLCFAVPKGALQQNLLSRLSGFFGSTDYQQAGAMRQTMVQVIHEDFSPLLPHLRQPTLLVWGEKT